MPRARPPNPRVLRLRELAGDPAAQAALATEIVAQEKDAAAVRAALEVLARRPNAAARPALLQRYDYFSADGVRRDAGGYLRAALLGALRPLARPEDLPRLEQAATTYEFLPPGRSEEGALLRATALPLLSDLDPELAAYHAARLLVDPHTSRLSGEPALTAVRVLAALGNRWPLYSFALHPFCPPGLAVPVPEVLSECLRNLAGMPASRLPELIDRWGQVEDEVVAVGLMDLVLEYPALEAARAYVDRCLRAPALPAAYRYLVACLVARPDPAWRARLAAAAEAERDPARLAALADALALAPGDPDLRAALKAIKARQKRRASS
jgi:hypothetical protein